ncbi:MAG: ferredoxin [Methanoregula sp.]|nr:ferredoxin [Methanoregula sp.]
MNVVIDRSACVSCGVCWNTCPELFEQNPCDLFSQIAEQYRFSCDRAEGIIPEDINQCAREASALCPVQIIQLE